MEELRDRIIARYSLPTRPVRRGLFFFGIGKNPLDEAVSNISKRSILNTLRRDTHIVAEDFCKVYKKETELLNVESK